MNPGDRVVVNSDAYRAHGVNPGMCGRITSIVNKDLVYVAFDVPPTVLVMYNYHLVLTVVFNDKNIAETLNSKQTANDPKLPPNDKKFVDKEKMWEITQSICKGT